VWRALGALSPSDFAWSAMVNPPSIRLINPIEMDLSSASNAANNAVDDGGITGVHPGIDSPPRIRPNPRPKMMAIRTMNSIDRIKSSPSPSPIASFTPPNVSVVVSKLFLMVEKRNNLNSSSLNLLMAIRSHQANNDYHMPDDEHEIIIDGLNSHR
jgi:hypothetical protein